MEWINQKSLPEKTADALVEFIRVHNYSPGEKLPNEYDLSKEFEVSRNTLRQAIQLLAKRHILEVYRGAGTFISKKMGISDDPLGLSLVYDKNKMAKDLMQLRLMIEPKMASLAAQYATDKECLKLEQLCDEMEELLQLGKVYLHTDMAFHALIAACSRNTVLHNLIPSIHQALVLQENITDKKLGEKTIKGHRQIAQAIYKHHASDAYDAMLAHLMHNSDRINQIE